MEELTSGGGFLEVGGAERASDPEKTEEEKVLFWEGRAVNQCEHRVYRDDEDTGTEHPGTACTHRLQSTSLHNS